ncbi:trypsin-like peptidase domain-containing protein [Loktanella agnita]|uniref:trypsin-like peptidase domain-containing protein n=1 Tax=Loktanella agnita TaxID=287097 RepID=UPI003985BB30
MFKALAAFVFFVLSTFTAAAQDTFWVQIEAHQTATRAQDRAREFATGVDNVAGFYLGDGFYAIFIGPYSEEPQAQRALAVLQARNAVPRDAFVKNGRYFKEQFWPIGGSTAAPAPAEPTRNSDTLLDAADETPAEATASEADLSRADRQELQKALHWAGHYDGTIDGAFGVSTRSAMQSWQEASNKPGTGILTTQQRAELLDSYNSVLDGMNMRLVRDNASGIQMLVPTNVVRFTEYKPPFVRFEASGDIPDALVLFISQEGNAETLATLYEVFQILDFVPADGARNLSDTGFEIEGIGGGIHSYTSVSLQDGAIKGFSLIWPEGDNPRRTRILAQMTDSFERRDGVLDPNIVPAVENQGLDMMAGRALSQPRLSRSGFYVGADGTVATTPDAVQNCTRITLDRNTDAAVILTDDDLGIALLRPNIPPTAISVARFRTDAPQVQDQIAVAGYPFNGALSTPTLTFGQVADLRNLSGDTRLNRLSVLTRPGDAGGPVFDETGAVLGMLLPRADSISRVLPSEVNFSVDAAQIMALMVKSGVSGTPAGSTATISPVALTKQASEMTLSVSCW